ncbi:MAG: hypothetical protein JKY48_10880 [Flavobacteriales bacterium]|nr:hypothetical protein [Flavobacteriales bacterium]
MERTIIGFLFFLSLVSCQEKTSFDSVAEYRQWIYSEESGYLQTVEKEGLVFELVYLPQALQQNKMFAKEADSILDLSFQLKISTTEQEELLKRNLGSQESYQGRIKQLEFQMERLFYAQVPEQIKPSFSHYENFRGIKNEILVHVHFSIPSQLKSDVQVFFKDEVFQTGTHQFNFDQNKILHPPILNLKAS